METDQEYQIETSSGMRNYIGKVFDCIESILTNKNLSDTQKVILLYAWNKPDKYKFWVKELEKVLTCSKEARQKAMKGLAELGLAELVNESNGKEIKRYWTIKFNFQQQVNIIPVVNDEKTALSPSVGFPSDGKGSHIVNNIISNNTHKPVEYTAVFPSDGKAADGETLKTPEYIPPNLDKIPKAMQKLPQWVYWKAELLADGKPTKVPYCEKNIRAKTNDLKTWKTFEAVRDWKEKGMTGIGFVLTDKDRYSIIDLDKCIVDMHWNEFARKTVKAFASYAELSPSGTGIHIIVEGKCTRAVKTKEIEIYYSGRYMAMTGIVLNDLPIKNRQILLNNMLESCFGEFMLTSSPAIVYIL